MFLGFYEPSLLEKKRFALPKRIRSEIKGNRVILTVGFDTCIFGFDEKVWQDVVRPELEKPFFSDSEARKMRRKMCVNASIVTLDSQSRLVLPDMMVDQAQIHETIVLVGAGDHFEIWDKELWEAYRETL